MDGNERLLYAAFRETFSSRHRQRRSHAIYGKKKGNKKRLKGGGKEGIAIEWIVVVYRYFVPRE